MIIYCFTSHREYFAHMETSPMPVKGCKILAYARHSGPLSREGSLSCHTCCDTGPRVFRSQTNDRSIQSPLTTRKGMLRTYSNPDRHGYKRHLGLDPSVTMINHCNTFLLAALNFNFWTYLNEYNGDVYTTLQWWIQDLLKEGTRSFEKGACYTSLARCL